MMNRFRTLELSNPSLERDHLRYATIKSRYLKGRGDCTFYIPPASRRQQSIDVTILLHGVYASHWAWSSAINAHGITSQLIDSGQLRPMVLVMPSDGLWGDGTGYFRHPTADYEKWIVKDIIEATSIVLKRPRRKIRFFIAGLSMGGYGALRLMAKYPKIFMGASGLSSVTSLADLMRFLPANERRYFRTNFQKEELIGYLGKRNAGLCQFRFDCGSQDPLLSSNRKLHRELERYGVPHVYEEFRGGHNNRYWNRHLARTLLYFNEVVP